MDIEEIICPRDWYKKWTAPKKCRGKFFEAEKVYVYNDVCDGVWSIGSQIGEESTYGKAYVACCDKNCKYVMKEVIFDKYSTKEMFIKEADIQSRIAALGLAPAVYDVILGKDRAVMIMEPMTFTARRYLKDSGRDIKKIDEVIEELMLLIDILHKHGMYHGDTHLDNFMSNDEGSTWKFIDFGNSGVLPDKGDMDREERIRIDFHQLYVSVMMDFDYTSKSLEDKIKEIDSIIKKG